MGKTIGLIFSGYGQQSVTMGKTLYDKKREVQDLFEQASMCLDINFVQLCFASSSTELAEIDKGYVAILLLQTALYSQLAEIGVRPDFIAGYGIGEFAATVASGSLSFADALYLLHKYSKFMKDFFEQNQNLGILSLPRGFTKESLQALCQSLSKEDKKIFIAAHNTESGFYVAGDKDLIEQLQDYCKMHEIRKVKELPVAYGMHSSLVDSIVTLLAPYFYKIDFKPLRYPVITNVDGVYVTSPDALESAILRRINGPILWDELMDGFIGCDILICVGPGKQVAEWAALKYPEKAIYTIEDLQDIKLLKEILEKEEIEDKNIDDLNNILQVADQDHSAVILSQDLTIADEINELSEDYDEDESDEIISRDE